jgi:Protein of unknown function (DUF3106)
MAGYVRLLTISALCGLAWNAVAQSDIKPVAAEGKPDKRAGSPKPKAILKDDKSPEMENVRKAIEALSPEQRKRFTENMWRWSELSPEEKKTLRDRDAVRKKVVQQEIEAAMKASGLNFDDDARQRFAKRYTEERKKIEEQLRKDMNERRKPLVQGMIESLKAEFSSGTAGAK